MHWNIAVKVYLLLCAHGVPEEMRPRRCPHCGATVTLHRHGKFTRWVFTVTEALQVPIYRFLCPCCRHTMSLLPSFIEAHHQAATDIKETVVREHADDQSQAHIASQTQRLPGGAWSEKTIRSWIRRWTERRSAMEARLWRWGLHHAPSAALPRERLSDWRALFSWWPSLSVPEPGALFQLLLAFTRPRTLTVDGLSPHKSCP